MVSSGEGDQVKSSVSSVVSGRGGGGSLHFHFVLKGKAQTKLCF